MVEFSKVAFEFIIEIKIEIYQLAVCEYVAKIYLTKTKHSIGHY